MKTYFFTVCNILCVLLLITSCTQASPISTKDIDKVLAHEMLSFTTRYITDTTAIESNIRDYMLAHSRSTDKREEKWGEWMSVLYFQLAQYHYEIRDGDYIKVLTKQYKRLLEKYDTPVICYHWYTLRATFMMEQLLSDSDSVSSEKMPYVVSQYQEAVRYLKMIPNKQIERNKIEPMWLYYNIALIHEKFDVDQATDSVQKYLNIGKDWANRISKENDSAAYSEYMIKSNNLEAYMHLKKHNTKEALQDVKRAMTYLDAQHMSPLSYQSSRMACLFCLHDIYQEKKDYVAALQYADSIIQCQERRSRLRQMALQKVASKYADMCAQEMALEKMNAAHAGVRHVVLFLILWLGLIGTGLYIGYRVCRLKRGSVDTVSKSPSIPVAEKHPVHELATKITLEYRNLKNQSDKLRQSILCNQIIPEERKKRYLASLEDINYGYLEEILSKSTKRLTSTDKYYILCFLIEITVQDVTILLNVEPTTVYAVRYRIKKKFPKKAHDALTTFQ